MINPLSFVDVFPSLQRNQFVKLFHLTYRNLDNSETQSVKLFFVIYFLFPVFKNGQKLCLLNHSSGTLGSQIMALVPLGSLRQSWHFGLNLCEVSAEVASIMACQ